MIRKRCNANVSKRTRRMIATATAFTFVCQNFAWAVCADGTTFPVNGYVNGQLVTGRLYGHCRIDLHPG